MIFFQKTINFFFSQCIMMNSLGLKEEKIVEGQIIKNIRNLLKPKRQNEAIKAKTE